MTLLELPYRQILIVATSGLVVCGLAYLGFSARPRRHGWWRIEPSPMHWTGLSLGGGLVPLFLYVRLFVGSSRADAQFQMNILTGLIVAFSLGVALCAWSVGRVRGLAFEWRGNLLVYNRGSERAARTVLELTGVRRSALGWLVLSFDDGETLKLDEHARGSYEFLRSVSECRPDLDVPTI